MTSVDKQFICHFTEMEYCAADGELGQAIEWAECKHCGCIKDTSGRVLDPETGNPRKQKFSDPIYSSVIKIAEAV